MRPIDETIEDIRQQAQLNQGKKITSCFLQDGDALVLKTDYLLRILEAINQGFPDMQYITSYARADSITRKSPAELKALRQAGLNHLYSGMETGSDRILKLINKGFDVDTVVKSGCMAKEADMILSEFILLGIGGKELSEENAVQTAMALNIIQPDLSVSMPRVLSRSPSWASLSGTALLLCIGGRNRCRAEAILAATT